MAYQISEIAKKHTTKCLYNFECVNNDKWDRCSIEKELDGGLVVKNKCRQKFCNYSLSFGYSYFCICPIRCEIYRRNKI